jgi:hypothetical protein
MEETESQFLGYITTLLWLILTTTAGYDLWKNSRFVCQVMSPILWLPKFRYFIFFPC